MQIQGTCWENAVRGDSTSVTRRDAFAINPLFVYAHRLTCGGDHTGFTEFATGFTALATSFTGFTIWSKQPYNSFIEFICPTFFC